MNEVEVRDPKNIVKAMEKLDINIDEDFYVTAVPNVGKKLTLVYDSKEKTITYE